MRALLRAQHLGSTAVTVRVRCSCGHKSDFNKYYWHRRGYAICDQCKCFILYHSLQIKDSTWEGYMEIDNQLEAGELEAYRVMEAELRSFIERYDTHPEWHWAPRTVRMVQAIRPQLARLDELRRPGVARAA